MAFLRFFILFALVFPLLTACGVKKPPMPPDEAEAASQNEPSPTKKEKKSRPSKKYSPVLKESN